MSYPLTFDGSMHHLQVAAASIAGTGCGAGWHSHAVNMKDNLAMMLIHGSAQGVRTCRKVEAPWEACIHCIAIASEVVVPRRSALTTV